MEIFYQDEHLIVVYKPYGVLSEAHESKPNLPALLGEEIGARIYPVHRLDRTTQGLMVYAKTEEAARRLSAMLQNGGIEKTYLAVIEGKPAEKEGKLTDLLFFDRRKNKSFVVKRERNGVKRAELDYTVLSTGEIDGNAVSLVKIRLLTGRTHQIRVQFASRKMPLVGDRRYGSRISDDEIALCSAELSFKHPFTGEALAFRYEPKQEIFRSLMG